MDKKKKEITAFTVLIAFIGIMTGASAQAIRQAMTESNIAGNLMIVVTGVLAITLAYCIARSEQIINNIYAGEEE